MSTVSNQNQSDFVKQSSAEQSGIVRELFELVATNKKWWLLPVVAVLLLVGGVILLGGTAMAPFIYTLF